MTMPPPPPSSSSFSPSPSFCSMEDLTRPFDRMLRDDKDDHSDLPMSARECLIELIQQVEHDKLRQVLKLELKRLLTDHERLVTMLQQRTQQLEQENDQFKAVSDEHQRRYEKAVREMQFFKKKFDYVSKQQQPPPPPTPVASSQQPSLVHSTSSSTTSRSLSAESDTLSELPTFSNSSSSVPHHQHHHILHHHTGAFSHPPPPLPPTHINNSNSSSNSSNINSTNNQAITAPPQQPPPPPPPQQQPLPPTPASPPQQRLQQPPLSGYPLTPTSPQPSVISDSYESQHSSNAAAAATVVTRGGAIPSRSSSTSTASSLLHHYQQQQQTPPQSYWNGTPLPSVSSVSSSSTATMSLADNAMRQPPNHPIRHPGTNSIYSVSSDLTTDSASIHNNNNHHNIQQLGGQGGNNRAYLRHNPSIHSSYSSPSTASSTMSGSANGGSGGGGPGSIGPGSSSATSVYSVPMTPVRSTTSTAGYTGSSMIQQRRVDPLMYGGSDGLWDTIAKSKGSDVTVEKIISNFLRRGGSPNTAKQSPSASAVKYGYGMIHALIVTKAPGALDLLLQQGANPNAMTMGDVEEDKVTPCYLAASVGWLAGLQKLVQAGGDLVHARGQGSRNKTALHAAAEHCHAAVVEFIVGYTQGALNLEVDSIGATALHYASVSGHTDLVCFLIRSCRIPADQADHRGEQPIHWASRAGRLEVVTLLVERFSCDINAYVSKRVPTPLELAKSNSHKRLVDYLKGLGALSTKKMDKKRNEEKSKTVSGHLANTLASNGLFGGGDDDGFF